MKQHVWRVKQLWSGESTSSTLQILVLCLAPKFYSPYYFLPNALPLSRVKIVVKGAIFKEHQSRVQTIPAGGSSTK